MCTVTCWTRTRTGPKPGPERAIISPALIASRSSSTLPPLEPCCPGGVLWILPLRSVGSSPPLTAGPPPSPLGSASRIWGSGLLGKTRNPVQHKGRTRSRSLVRPAASLARLCGTALTGRNLEDFQGLFYVRGSWKTRRSCVRLFWFWL